MTLPGVDVHAEAESICRRFDTATSPIEAELSVLADWETGSTRAPVAANDVSAFLVAAVAVYCPQYFDAVGKP